MIIGRKDRERVAQMKAILAAQEERLYKKDKRLAYKSALVRTREEEIEILKETNLMMRERIRELEGEAEKKAEAPSCSNYRKNGTCRGCMHEECCPFYTE